jgi:hypothetical protein
MKKHFFLAAIIIMSMISCSDMISTYLSKQEPLFDYVFVIDMTGSMDYDMPDIKTGLNAFLNLMEEEKHDTRYSIVLFGGNTIPHELLLDWTEDEETVKNTINMNITTSGGLDFSFETIRIVLNAAKNNTLDRTYAGGEGPLLFRSHCKKRIILITDEPSDLPHYFENRYPGQTGSPPQTFPADPSNGWFQELLATADALIDNNISTYLFIDPGMGISSSQFGEPSCQSQNADYSHFHPSGTLDNLIEHGFDGCLQAQLLKAGITSRVVDILQIANPDVIEHVLMQSIND